MQNSEIIWELVDAKRQPFEALSDRVWGMPEIAYTEYGSVAEHIAMLKEQGFRITENVAGIPTAVMGEAGEGGPVIAILGEYDALPGLSQEANIAEPKPVEVDYLAECEKSLSRRLGRGVKIVSGKRKGKIELEYYGQEDLQRLYEALTKTLGKEQP